MREFFRTRDDFHEFNTKKYFYRDEKPLRPGPRVGSHPGASRMVPRTHKVVD
jgi:hypothetical protein